GPAGDDGSPAPTATGVVDGVTFGSQGPVLSIDGTDVALAALHTVTRPGIGPDAGTAAATPADD
ncbi:hypothetical protein, partial [Nocardioides massiliensis]